jgi:hypothetical protein
MTDLIDRKGSVTKQDFVQSPDQGVWAWTVFDPGAMTSPVATLPVHGSRGGDRVLAATLDLEDMWASAIAKAVTKIAVRGYEISDSDDSTRRTEYGQGLIRNLDGPARYREGVVKTVTDFLTTDNGWFIEVVRAGNKANGKVMGLYHLDSFRCYRTGNLNYPVLYIDWEGGWHKLRGDQVIFGSDMPSPRTRLWGIGRCAARRAFQTITTLSATKTYYREKITGSRALTLYFITGVSRRQLQDAMETSEAEKIRKGHVVYKGAVMVPIQTDQPINVAPLDLAGVADGFDVDQVEKSSLRTYAIAIGLNPDELVERAAGLNSGASAQVAEQAAEEAGGLPYFVKDLEDKLNFLVMPKATIFQVKTNDIRDQQMKATLNKLKADTLVVLNGNQPIITQDMALQIAVDEGLVPPEFLPQDVTPQGTLTDSGDQSKPVEATPRAPYAGQLPAPVAPVPATKADDPDMVSRLVAANMEYMRAQMERAASKAYEEAYEYAVNHPADLSGWKRLSDIEMATKAKEEDWAEAVKWAEEASKDG